MENAISACFGSEPQEKHLLEIIGILNLLEHIIFERYCGGIDLTFYVLPIERKYRHLLLTCTLWVGLE